MNPQCLDTAVSVVRQRVRRCLAHLLLALMATLPCAPLLAEEVAWSNTVGVEQEELSWMSGGIGDEALQAMRQQAAAYNVHVRFTDRQGSYLANIPFKVAGRDGRPIYSGVSDGPLLYLRLPGGTYRVSAEIDSVWQSRSVRVNRSGRPAAVSFVARGE